jgi:phytoene dehydrogenase-like protein
MERLDAVVVGSGPNGLAAAIVLAEAGLTVRVYEAAGSLGGGCRTQELTVPGFRHDVCSAALPLAIASAFFKHFDLERRGVRMLQPEVPFAHPLDGGRAAAAFRSVEATASALGADGTAYSRLLAPLVASSDAVVGAALSSYREVPPHPLIAARFALLGLLPALSLARRFGTVEARALMGGVAAHAMEPLDRPLTGGIGLLLGTLAHAVGWPVVEGGSGSIVEAMVRALRTSGVEIVTDHAVTSLAELPPARAVLLDVTPRALAALAGDRLPSQYLRSLRRFRYGAGVCKVDWALDGPVPWEAEVCRRAGTLHLGGPIEQVAHAESEVAAGRHPDRPFVLVVQPGVVDPTRAPAGKHTLWTYCHVPSHSDRDMTTAIASQIERFAPGFRDLVAGSAVRSAAQMEVENPNYVGGDIGSGVQNLRQTVFRPVVRWDTHRTPIRGVYLCSASTPPGPGVHGRCGELAARRALRDLFGTGARDTVTPTVASG